MEEKMKTLSLRLIALLLVAPTMLTVSSISIAQNTNSEAGTETSVVGYISDSMCGLKHMSGMGDDKSCTLACVKGGSKFVLADRDHKVVYRLDNTGQEKAREFAGQKVKVTGRVTGKTIKVTSIEAAS